MIKEFLEGETLKLNKIGIENFGYTASEFLYLLGICFNDNNNDVISSLHKKGDIMKVTDKDGNSSLEVSPLGIDRIESILIHINDIKDTPDKPEEIDYLGIAAAMQEEYPKGRKAGTNYNWRGSAVVIAARLKTLAKKYNVPITKESVVSATRNYIKSFNGDYRYMQILKYFIFKNENKNGSMEFESQLMSYIENLGQEDYNNDWTSTLK